MMIWMWPLLQVSVPVAVFNAFSCLQMRVACVITLHCILECSEVMMTREAPPALIVVF